MWLPVFIFVYLCVCVCECIGISGTLAGTIDKNSSKQREKIIILSLASDHPRST